MLFGHDISSRSAEGYHYRKRCRRRRVGRVGGSSLPGIDRIVMLLYGPENQREVVLLPMNQGAEDERAVRKPRRNNANWKLPSGVGRVTGRVCVTARWIARPPDAVFDTRMLLGGRLAAASRRENSD